MERTEVLIVGLGPAGLMLALLLGRRGITVICVDKRIDLAEMSRAIGIHPPSLELINELGLLNTFLMYGEKISRADLYYEKVFQCSVPINAVKADYVLSLPQIITEEILTNAILKESSVCMRRGSILSGLNKQEGSVIATFVKGDSIQAKIVVGADGLKSTVRDILGFNMDGAMYKDVYAMVDVSAAYGESKSACICLGGEGLLEIFPLGGGGQRLVARIGSNLSEGRKVDRDAFKQIIMHRKPKGLSVGEVQNDPQVFWAEHYVSSQFYSGRVVLLGDASHVVSPIGGQGMNLGWIGAKNLSVAIQQVLRHGSGVDLQFRQYEKTMKKIAMKVQRRSEVNMSFGRPGRTLKLRTKLLKGLLGSHLRDRMIDMFTMGGLK